MASPIYLVTVTAPTNIAVIKYWGKADKNFNTPINDSLSVTLSQSDLRAVTTVAASSSFTSDRLWLNGLEVEDPRSNKRFCACVDQVKELAQDKDGVSAKEWQSWKVHVSSYNSFPTAAGLASSAAGYAALVAALAELYGAKEEFEGQLTTIARQGSGSACRSLYGGFVAWRQGSPPEWKDSKAVQIAPPEHWPDMKALILVVSDKEKDTSSTTGMQTSVDTSELLKHRAQEIVSKRMKLMEEAILAKDFETFGKITMQDSNQFHATCLDTYPPIFYMNDVSHSIIRIVTLYNAFYEGPIRAAYTFDAGPNAVLYVLQENLVELGALMLHYFPSSSKLDEYMKQADLAETMQNFSLDPALLKACDPARRQPTPGDVQSIYVTKSGPGPQVVNEPNLDPQTGLNTYSPPKK
jgi:diphosphomevalonate decarboxylase